MYVFVFEDIDRLGGERYLDVNDLALLWCASVNSDPFSKIDSVPFTKTIDKFPYIWIVGLKGFGSKDRDRNTCMRVYEIS